MTKSDWIMNTAIIFMNGVPTYKLVDAEALVVTYLTNVAGGWASTEVGDSDGNGAPINNQSPTQAANALIAVEFGNTKTLTYTFRTRVTARAVGTFPPGTSTADIITALKPNFENRIQDALSDHHIEYVGMDYASATSAVRTTGLLTASNRVAVQAEITGQPRLTDPCAIATQFVRENFDKNNQWMAEKLYKRSQYPIVVYVRKYTNTTYTSLEETYVEGGKNIRNEGYILYVDEASLQVQNCLTSPNKTVI